MNRVQLSTLSHNAAEVTVSGAKAQLLSFEFKLVANMSNGKLRLLDGYRLTRKTKKFTNQGYLEIGPGSELKIDGGDYVQAGGETRVDGELNTVGGRVIKQGGKITGSGTINGQPVGG